MTDTTDESWDDLVLDENGKVKPPKRRPLGKDNLPDPEKILPRVLLESALTKAELREIDSRDAYCLIVQVPSADWATPMFHELKSRSDWDDTLARTSIPRGKSEEAVRTQIRALATGGRVFGISQTPSMLPAAMLSGADRTVILPAISGPVLAKAIKQISGKLPVDVPHALGAGLTFDEIVSCLRPGSTASECVDRLKKATQRKVVQASDTSVPALEQLHGYGAAMNWALDLVGDLDAWRRGELEWSDLSAAVVLASAPGLGKTSMVRSLAKSLNVPMVSTSVATWFSRGGGYLDAVIRQIDEVFALAKAQSPSILFLDEIDAVPSRFNLDSKNADYWAVVVTHLLTLLDGAISGTTQKIILVSATNLPHMLDPALVRPGRFSRIIFIDPPDEDALKGILRQHLGNDLAGEDLTGTARLAVGSSGATVVDYVKTARRVARQAKRPMQMTDLIDAIAPPDERSDDYIERVAIHESGHAVLAHVTGHASIKAISIVRRGSTGGFVETDHDGQAPVRGDVEKLVIQALGGRAAEEVILGEPGTGSGGASDSDLAFVTHHVAMLHLASGLGESMLYRSNPDRLLDALARHPGVAASVEAEIRRLYAEAIRLARLHADAIVAVSEELMVHRHLNGQQFLEAFESIKAPREWGLAPGSSSHG